MTLLFPPIRCAAIFGGDLWVDKPSVRLVASFLLAYHAVGFAGNVCLQSCKYDVGMEGDLYEK